MAPAHGNLRDHRDDASRDVDEAVRLFSAMTPTSDPVRSVDPRSLEHAQVKRFFEIWMADAGFRDQLLQDPVQAAAERGLTANPLNLRYLWDRGYREQLEARGLSLDEFLQESPLETQQLLAWMRNSHQLRDRMRSESRPQDSRFAGWRDRQIARSTTIFSRTYDLFTPHILFAIELGKGCSVGCWFCGVSAPKVGEQFLHSQANGRLFLDVLSSLKAFTGSAAGAWGFLYWATDPFDNPDFEAFCLDFQTVFGRFPIVTTAQPHRDIKRARALLQLAMSHGATKVRFSITTQRLLDRIHREFTAEELAFVDLIAINPGSILRPAASGRARERYLNKGGESLEWAKSTADTSISCVSGFLLNMVDRTIKLITPCESSERWPLGYFVYDERRFNTGAEVRDIAEDMIARHMPTAVRSDSVLRFRRDLSFQETADGFALNARYGRSTIAHSPLLSEVADAIACGEQTTGTIVNAFCENYGLEQSVPSEWISQLFALGLIDEEPREGPAS